MTFLPLPCFPSFRASRWALAGNPREQSLLMELTALEGAAICVEGAGTLQTRRPAGDNEARTTGSGCHVESQGESSSGRSNCSAKTPWWEHARHARRAGRGSVRKETGLGGAGEVGRGHSEDLAGVERIERRSAVSSEGLRAEV